MKSRLCTLVPRFKTTQALGLFRRLEVMLLTGARQDQTNSSSAPLERFRLLVLLVIIALAGAVRVIAWLRNVDFWLDEAMLFQALKKQSALLPWVPLSEYTQAVPFLPGLLWKVLIAHFGPDGLVLRLPSLVASVLGLWTLWHVLRRYLHPAGMAAALILVGFSETAIVQSAQLKPYSFEFLASALILLAGSRLKDKPESAARAAEFAAISIAALAFTYTAPVVTAAVAGGGALAFATRGWPSRAALLHLGAWALGWFVAVLAWHSLIVGPSTAYQFVGNDRSYAWEYVSLAHPSTWHHLGRILNVLAPALSVRFAPKVLTLAACTTWTVGISAGRRHRQFEHGTCVGAVICLTVLSLDRLFPFAEPRKMLFLLPLFALSFGASIDDLSPYLRKVLHGNRGQLAIPVILAMVLFPLSIVATAGANRGDVGKLISAIPQQACSEVWSFYLSWPAVETYRALRPDLAFAGQIPTASAVPSWSWRVYDDFPNYVSDLTHFVGEHPRACLLFSHDDGKEQRREKAALLAAVAPHKCSEFLQTLGATLYRCGSAPGADSARASAFK